jgi:hypothetical protein
LNIEIWWSDGMIDDSKKEQIDIERIDNEIRMARARRDAAQAEIAIATALLAALERIRGTGAATPDRNGSVVKLLPRKPNGRESGPRAKIASYVASRGLDGATMGEILDNVIGQFDTTSANPRGLVITTTHQLENKGRLERRNDRFYERH